MYTYMYMGKNYTLYIKDERFGTEPNKGGLVNELLEKHYGGVKHTNKIISDVAPIATHLNPTAKFDTKKQKDFQTLKEAMANGTLDTKSVVAEVKSCCTNKKKLCSHWTWDGSQNAHINSLTGEIIEAPAW